MINYMFGAKYTSDVELTSQILGLNISVVRYQILVFGNISAVELKRSVDGLLYQRLKIYSYQFLVSGFYGSREGISDVDQGLRNQTLAYSKFIYQSAMAYSFFVNTVHICFESVLVMDNTGIVAMFESFVATGLKGFLGCPAVIHEAALLEFFQNGSVRDGLVVSTMNGMTVEISEQLFVETFELPVEGLTDFSEIPKDIVFDARRIVSLSGEPVSTSGKKREMTIEFRLLCDILAKTISVKAGSFDAITQEKFLMIAAITCGVKINWNRLLNILKDMVTPGSRQAKGYAIQISLLLENVPNLELGESSEFPSSNIQTEKIVYCYISLNDKVCVEDVTAEARVKRPPVKRAASKKRPAVTTAAEPVVKKKRTMVCVDGVWVIEPCGDHWVKIPQKIVSNEISRQRSYDDTLPPVSAFFKLMKKRWGDVCIEVAQFSVSGKLLPFGDGVNYVQLLFSCLSTEDIRSFVSTNALDRSVLIDVQLVQSSVFLSLLLLLLYGNFSTLVANQSRDSRKTNNALSEVFCKIDHVERVFLDNLAELNETFRGYSNLSLLLLLLYGNFSTLVANQSRDSRKTNNALSEVFCKIDHVERVFLDNLAELNETFRGLFKRSRQEAQNDNHALSLALKAVRTQNVILSTDLEANRKEVKDLNVAFSKYFDDKLADIRNELLEFRVDTQGQLDSLSTHLAELIAFLNKGSDDKKGEDSSSRRPQPPPDNQVRTSGGSGGSDNRADEQRRPVGSGTRESGGGSGSQRRGDSSGS
ncbi:hypothetical protein F511_12998 [Dorcoceras hygrometricum]|uniref:Dystroglycan-like n=1 Tax=Dorcoceras hygrometricum TaxID=472368 RepID=A0A2Z7BY01_9LAMI|nr:hypothetical protein F511_12998 [Dorcoceras hygrometricum]